MLCFNRNCQCSSFWQSQYKHGSWVAVVLSVLFSVCVANGLFVSLATIFPVKVTDWYLLGSPQLWL